MSVIASPVQPTHKASPLWAQTTSPTTQHRETQAAKRKEKTSMIQEECAAETCTPRKRKAIGLYWKSNGLKSSTEVF